jgi:hypothetical protein
MSYHGSGPVVTNETLAAMLKVQHEAVTQRLEELTEAVKETNGRLRDVERVSAVHSWAIGLVGATALVLFGVVLNLLFRP